MQRFAMVKKNGTVRTVTMANGKLDPDWVEITDTSITVGDVIDKNTGALISRYVPDQQESKQKCKETVRQVLRDCDWTQASDNLGVGKQNDWKVYRQAVRDAWQAAKNLPDPYNQMVWPDPPGDASDGL